MRMLPCCALVLGLATSCFHPSPPEGSPCTSSEQCPTPQHCSLGHCLVHEPELDASMPVDVAPPIDAAIDAAPLACSTAGLSCAGTPTMFSCGGQCWVGCPDLVTREVARVACTGWHGALGKIDDATEQTCVAGHVGAGMWIGLIQPVGSATATAGWTWNAVTPVVYTHWAPGEPEDGDGRENGLEQCGDIQSTGNWDDVVCDAPIGFACERPQ